MFGFNSGEKEEINPRGLRYIENHTPSDFKNAVVLVPHGATLWVFTSNIRMSPYMV